MSHILVTGNAVWDIVNVMHHYPQEDEELRALTQWATCGGNAVNMLRVLAAKQHRCEFMGVLANDAFGESIQHYLHQQQISTEHVTPIQGHSPVSTILLNNEHASRTIIHYRDLPELSAQDFYRLPVTRYDWLHFEGRNVIQLADMLAYARDQVIDQPISLECEKVRTGLETLLPLCDIALFSRSYAQAQGFNDAQSFLRTKQQRFPTILMTCTWGEQGAWALDLSGNLLHAPAPRITPVVDTLGAGDVFNAGLIHALVTGEPFEVALQQAVNLASRKVAQQGFNGL